MFKKLNQFITKNVIQYGTFELASGQTSNVYFDAKRITLDAEGLSLSIANLFHLMQKQAEFQAIGGKELGAVPILSAMLFYCSYKFKGFIVRKQPKKHGTQKFIEGPVESGMRVAIVEDVTTTGQSAKFAIDKAREFGLIPVVVGTVIDRNQGAKELFHKEGLPFVYLESFPQE